MQDKSNLENNIFFFKLLTLIYPPVILLIDSFLNFIEFPNALVIPFFFVYSFFLIDYTYRS